MPTSSLGADVRRAATPVLSAPLIRRLVAVNVAVPLALLGWDAVHHQLGVNGVNFALHTTGLVALVLLLLSLAVTPLRRLSGWSVLVAARRGLGLGAFVYLCVHLGIFVLFDRGGSLASTVHEIATRRYLQVGTAAFVLLAPLAFTSTNAMVERLGAKRWKELHRLTYLAVPLGAIHYYLLVKSDVRQPLAFAGALAALLAVRPALGLLDRRRKLSRREATKPPRAHLRRPWSGELSVLRVTDETPDVRTFRLGPLAGARLPFTHQPGQYLNLALPIDGARRSRSFTIASSPTQQAFCEITVKRTVERSGKRAERSSASVTRYLHESIAPGARLRVSAPAGRFVFTGAGERAVLFVAGGVGITPLMAMIRYLTDTSWAGDIHLVFAVRQERDIVFRAELELLQSRFPRLHVTVVLSAEDSPTWPGERGRISADLLRRVVPDVAARPVYLCGPEGMMAAMRAILEGLGVSPSRIFTEDFAGPTAPASQVVTRVEDTTPLPQPSSHGEEAPTVTFRRSARQASPRAGETILDAGEALGLDLPFECRAGICGQCKLRLLAGRVTMEVEDALTPSDRARGLVLACQARATTDVTVDA